MAVVSQILVYPKESHLSQPCEPKDQISLQRGFKLSSRAVSQDLLDWLGSWAPKNSTKDDHSARPQLWASDCPTLRPSDPLLHDLSDLRLKTHVQHAIGLSGNCWNCWNSSSVPSPSLVTHWCQVVPQQLRMSIRCRWSPLSNTTWRGMLYPSKLTIWNIYENISMSISISISICILYIYMFFFWSRSGSTHGFNNYPPSISCGNWKSTVYIYIYTIYIYTIYIYTIYIYYIYIYYIYTIYILYIYYIYTIYIYILYIYTIYILYIYYIYTIYIYYIYTIYILYIYYIYTIYIYTIYILYIYYIYTIYILYIYYICVGFLSKTRFFSPSR